MLKDKQAPVADISIGYPIGENPYPSIVVDITSRCNLKCNFCYNPVRTQEDMSVEQFEYICSALPAPVSLKLSGGEPTLHQDIIEFLRIAHKHRHISSILSNGLRYTDRSFMDSLAGLRREGIPVFLVLSMDGGFHNRYAYETINGADCLEYKIEAFKSVVSYNIFRLTLSAIIVRGLNEDVIADLTEAAYKHDSVIRYLHFRNAGKVGKWRETLPYTIEELRMLARPLFSEESFKPHCVREPHCPPESGNKCCYRFRPTDMLQVSLLEFNTEMASKCRLRGRIAFGSGKVKQLFYSMR